MEIDKDLLQKYKKTKTSGAIDKVSGVGDVAQDYARYLGKSALQGPADIAAGALNLIPGLQQKVGNPNKPFRANIQENPHEGAYALGSMATPFGVFGKAIGLAGKVPGVAKGLAGKILPKGRPGLPGTIGRETAKGASRGALASAGIGETLRPEGTEQYENLGFNAGLGGLLGGTMGSAAGIIPGFANKTIRNAEKAYKETPNLIRSPREVSEISKDLPSDVRVNLGELTKEPSSKAFYTDVLGNSPFSNVRKNERKALNAATEKTNSFVNDLLGGAHPGEVSKKLAESIKGKGLGNKKEASKYYGRAFKQADKSGLQIKETPTLERGIEKILKEHDKGWLKSFTDSDVAMLNRLAGKKESLGLSGGYENLSESAKKQAMKIAKGEREPLSLEQAKNLRSKLSSEARKASASMEDAKAKAFNDAATLLNDDISHQVKKTGNKALEKNWEQANKVYREEYVPYGKDKYIRDVMEGKKSLTPSKLVKDAQFKKVFGDLSEKDKNLVAFSLLNKAAKDEGGKIAATPADLARQAKSISPEMKSKAFTPKQIKDLEMQGALSEATKSAQKKAKEESPKSFKELSPETLYGDVKKYGLGFAASPFAKVGAKIMTSPAVRKSYETAKPLSKKELMKEFGFLNKAKYLRQATERGVYQFGKDK